MAAADVTATKSKPLRIVFLGKAGSGKSTTSNNIINKNLFQSSKSANPISKVCQQANTTQFGQDIQIVVTPGLFDTDGTNDEIIREIVKCIDISSSGPHVFFMTVKIGRFTPEENATVEYFRNVFGDNLFNYMAILFTCKDDLKYDDVSIEGYIQSVPSDLKTLLENCQNRYVAFDNRASQAERDDDIKHFIQVANTIVEDNNGSYYTTEMYEQARKNRKMQEEKVKMQTEAEQRVREEEIKARVQIEVRNEQAKKLAELEKKAANLFPVQDCVRQNQDCNTYSRRTDNVSVASTEMLSHSEEVKDSDKMTTDVMQRSTESAVPTSRELRVVFLGKTGSGKSTTGNNILQKNQFHSSACGTFVSKLCQLGRAKRFGQTIHIIDTPGMFDNGMTNEQITAELIKCIGLSSPGPHVFFMITRIGHFTPDEKATVEHFRRVFGDDMLRHLSVLFTGKDNLKHDEMSIEEYITYSHPELKKLLESCNNRYVAVDNRASNVERDQAVREFLTLSNEIVKQNHGLCYTSEMYKVAEKFIHRHEEELRKQYEVKARVQKEMQTDDSKQLSRFEAEANELKNKPTSVITEDNRLLQANPHQQAAIYRHPKYAGSEDPINSQPSSTAEMEQQPNFHRIAQEDIMQNNGLLQELIDLFQNLGNRISALFQNNRN